MESESSSLLSAVSFATMRDPMPGIVMVDVELGSVPDMVETGNWELA